jgi:phage terminase large subunit
LQRVCRVTKTKTITIDLGYRCRKQFAPFHKRKQRWACLVAHRRAGKTVACVADLVDAALRCPKPNPRFAYIAPFFVQAKDVAWGYLKQFCAKIPGVSFNEAELRVDFPHNGARIRLYGADNYDRIRGVYLDGVILDEYADMPPAAWGEVIRPALADRQGWAVFIGTPKGRNAFWEVWERAKANPGGWFSLMLRASETGLISPAELAEASAEMTPEQVEQEFECSFDAAILGAYYAKEIADAERAGRITDVDVDPATPVHTAWDLGVGDSTAIWFFQVAGQEIRVVDHYENHGQGLPHYAGVLAAKGYGYGHDFVPHDARVKELGTGRTRVETLLSLGRKPRVVPAHSLMDGINAARVTVARCRFDRERCAQGLEALRQYRTDFDEKTKAFKDTPKHDWTSHTADAFRYLAMAWREMAQPEKPKDPIAEMLKPKTFNDLMEEFEQRDDD